MPRSITFGSGSPHRAAGFAGEHAKLRCLSAGQGPNTEAVIVEVLPSKEPTNGGAAHVASFFALFGKGRAQIVLPPEVDTRESRISERIRAEHRSRPRNTGDGLREQEES